MKELLDQYENKRPEIVFEWKDAETEAEGWVVINSLRGGAAGGGTRMRKGLDRREVESLAKTMEVKFTVAGPAIGGAKSGINFDPNDPRKRGVLERWFKAVMPLLKNYYGTGGDLNVDEIHDVIDITSKYGLQHPQQGVVRGHFGTDTDSTSKRIQNLRAGVTKKITDLQFAPSGSFTVSDMITGYGVAESVKHYYSIWGGSVKGKRVIIQGWGNVASAAGYYLAQDGALITAIIDRDGGVVNKKGFDFAAVKKLFLGKDGNKLRADGMLSPDEIQKQAWEAGAEIFIPAAASRLVTKEQIDKMITSGLECIACGANVPFADKEIFFGPIGEYTDSRISLIPDFISNCGMARVFAYLMGDKVELTDAAIFGDVSSTIRKAMEKTHAVSPAKTHIARAAFGIALKELV
ncbi:MAG TPA: Glu/Leu/Phe/Val dehydrogenase dimerization domain-containing protein [Bacteroidia bacterium]|nr:Glu/Leu/Phe/Val dehydrogenase dimerization domain-containing protein [Bacteroidia bacterium]